MDIFSHSSTAPSAPSARGVNGDRGRICVTCAINKEWTTFMKNKRSKKEIYRHRDRIEKKYFKSKSDNPPT